VGFFDPGEGQARSAEGEIGGLKHIDELREAARLEKIANDQKIKPNPWAGAADRLAADEKASASQNNEGQQLKGDMALYAYAIKKRDDLQVELNDARAALAVAVKRDRQVEYLFGECVQAYHWNRAYHNGVRQFVAEIEPGEKGHQGVLISTVVLRADGTPASPLHLSRMTPEQWEEVKRLRGLQNECRRLESLVRQACQPVGGIIGRYPSLRQTASL
jgi:hypothetical protein